MLRRSSLVAGVALLASWSGAAIAETQLSGELLADQHWTVAGSPYVISGVTYLAAGRSLAADPGVVVRLGPDARLHVAHDGEVSLVGTAAMPILFTSDSELPQPGDYGLLFLVPTEATVAIDHCIVEYGTGLFLGSSLDSGSVEVRSCILGVDVGTGSVVEVHGLHLHDNLLGGLGQEEGARATLVDCRIEANQGPGVMAVASGARLRDCQILDNAGVGADVVGEVAGCRIEGNQGGGLRSRGNVAITGCDVAGNGEFGIRLQSVPGPSAIHGCNIVDNAGHAVEVDATSTAATVDATGNWWGTADAGAIAALIRDAQDDPSLATTIDFDPYELSVATERSTWGVLKALFR